MMEVLQGLSFRDLLPILEQHTIRFMYVKITFTFWLSCSKISCEKKMGGGGCLYFSFLNPLISLQVNQNGHLTFASPLSTYVPSRFPLRGTTDIIAPFWTDLDNRQIGQIYYDQFSSGVVLQQATQDINNYFPSMNFIADWVFVATWHEVAYYPNSGTVSQFKMVIMVIYI